MKIKLTDEQVKALKDAGIEVPTKELDLEALAGVLRATVAPVMPFGVGGFEDRTAGALAKECNNFC